MYLARTQQPKRTMPPLPPATLIVDMRGKGDDLVQMLQVEVQNLSEEMKLHKVDLWCRLSDFISYGVPDLLNDEDLKILRKAAEQQSDHATNSTNTSKENGSASQYGGSSIQTATGSYETQDKANSFPRHFQPNYRHPFEDFDEETLPSYRNFEALIDEIDRIRNIRHNAVSELGKAGTVGHNVKEPGVRVIFLADARQSNSLTTTAACAWYLKKFYKRLERPGERTGRQIPINVSVLCLNHQNTDQNVPPAKLINGLRWENDWKHLDAVILSERYRQDIGRVDDDMQILLGELVLYTLLIVSPALAQIRSQPPRQSSDDGVDPNEEPVNLPPNTYLVGIASVENSTRWGYRLLNYGLAEQALELLRDGDLGDEQATTRNTVENWLNGWQGLVRSALPDNMPHDIPSLGGVVTARKTGAPAAGVFSNSQISLTLGERSIRELEDYLNSICTTYTASEDEQRMFRQQAEVRPTGFETLLPLTLQTAVDSVPQIERALDEWQGDSPENPLIKAQLEARRVLSHPTLFQGPTKAIPRAKLQLKELTATIIERRNRSQKNPINVKEKQERLRKNGKARIDDLRQHIASWPLFAAGLKAKRLMAWLDVIFFLFLCICFVTLGFAWLGELLHTGSSGTSSFISTPLFGSTFTLFYLIFWMVLIVALLVSIFIVGRILLDDKRSPAVVEITFCLLLFAISLAGLLFSLSITPLNNLGEGLTFVSWYPSSLLPWITTITLLTALIVTVIEVVSYFRWRAELERERELITSAIRAEHEKNIQDILDYISDALSFHLLMRAGLTDTRGGSGEYYKRLDELHNLLDLVYISASEQRRLAESRLGSNLSESSLRMRQELISVAALKRGYKRLGAEMESRRSELREMAETLLRTMGQETPGEIERNLRERSPHSNREQYYVQVLMEALTAVALRFALMVPPVDMLTPLQERYMELDTQVTHQLASLQPLTEMLESKVEGSNLDSGHESKVQNGSREYDIELATQALAAWGQMLWENKDTELSKVLAPGGVIAKLIRDKYNPQTIKETLGIRTSPSGRTTMSGPYDDLYLFVSFSPESRRFLKDFLPDSYIADFPDNERLALMHILHYAAKPVMIRRPALGSGSPSATGSDNQSPFVEGSVSANGNEALKQNDQSFNGHTDNEADDLDEAFPE